MSQIKINRARALSTIGTHQQSFAAMLRAIPASVVEALSSRDLAALIDANWRLALASRAIAAEDAIHEGGVWDNQRQAFIPLTQTPGHC